MSILTGAMLGRLFELAADGVERRACERDLARAIDVQEMLYTAASMAQGHGDAPVDVDITIGPSGSSEPSQDPALARLTELETQLATIREHWPLVDWDDGSARRAVDAILYPDDQPSRLELPLDRLSGLSTRTLNALFGHGHGPFKTVGEVLRAGRRRLWRVRNFGRVGMAELEGALERAGFTWPRGAA